MTHQRLLFTSLILTIFLITLIGCQQKDGQGGKQASPVSSKVEQQTQGQQKTPQPTTPGKTAQVNTKIKMALMGRVMTSLPFFIAQDHKLFEEQGLIVEFVDTKTNVAIAALASNEVDFISGFSVAVQGAVQGFPMKGIMVNHNYPQFTLVTAKDIKNPEQLKGKPVGVSAIGSNDHLLLSEFVKSKGIPLEQIIPISMGGTPDRYAGLTSGAIAGALMAPPHNIMLKNDGYNWLAEPHDFSEQPLAGLGTTDDNLKQKTELVKKMLHSTVGALRFIQEKKPETIESIIGFLKVDRDIATASYDFAMPSFSKDGTPSSQGVQSLIDLERSTRKIEVAIPFEQVIDLKLLKEVQKEMGI